MRWIYTCLFYLGMPLIWLRLWRRSLRNPDYRQRWAERLGHVPFTITPGCVWWHTVSVGEVLAAIPLIKQFQQHHPTTPILVTTMTPTGSVQVKAKLGESVQHVYAPYDLPHAVNRFLNHVRPKLLVIMETELWPNVLAACANRKIPVILTNARLSARSAKGYARFASVTKTMLAQITHLSAQNRADADRFLALGLPRDRLSITGTVKFDITIADTLMTQAKALRGQWHTQRPVWIAASTHQGEEEIILAAMEKIRLAYPDALLLLVPRHPDRAKEIIALCQQANLSFCLRSKQQLPDEHTAIFLIDTLGELLLFYAAADVAFVGGSLIDRGGHNVLEPAALGMPVITGKSMYNFAEIDQLLTQANALIKIQNANDLANTVTELFQDDQKRTALGNAAQAVINANRGATEKQLAIIEKIYDLP